MRGAGSARRHPRGCASPQPRPRAHGHGPRSGTDSRGRRPPRALASLRPCLPAGARDHTAAELAAAGERGHGGERGGGNHSVRRPRGDATARRGSRLRLVDRRDDRALGRGQDVLPADLLRREGGAVVRPHPHVRLARGPGRDGDGRPARAEARGGCRSAGDRRRLRLAAERRREGDVQQACRSRCADRRQRCASPRPRRSLPGPSPPRLAPGRGRPCRPPEALRDRRRGRVDRGRGNRGPLRERRLPRRDGARHRRRRPPGAGRLPHELPGPRRPPARRPRPLLPRAGRSRDDSGRACAGHPRRVRRRLAGDPRADRRRAPAARRDEPLPHGPRHARADPGGRPARRPRAHRRLGDVEQRAGERGPRASL